VSHTLSDQLTRHPGEYAPGVADISSDWTAHRDALRGELAPQSLADRVLAEGIECIACRAYHEGINEGHTLGSDAAHDDMIGWIEQLRQDRKPNAQAWGILAELERSVRQGWDRRAQEATA